MNEISASSLFGRLPGLGQSSAGGRSDATNVAYQEAALLARQSSISLTTAEGDRVTISADWSRASGLATSHSRQGGAMLSSYSLSGLEQQSYSLTVQGDLNEEELRDIERLVAKLTDIAYDFFNGDGEKAVQGALNLGSMGSISELSATFLQSSFSSQQLASQGIRPVGQVAAPLGGSASTTAQLPEAKEVYRYHDIIQAQWQQLKEWLEAETTSSGRAEPLPAATGRNRHLAPSERMLEEIKEAMADHPRLTPLSRALAEESVARAQSRFEQEHPDQPTPSSGDELRQRLGERLDNWLLSV